MFNKKIYNQKNPWINVLCCIRQRCTNKNKDGYKYYGGRGIKCLITAEELKILWFRDKACLMKQPSIDRIDSNGNYEFENCRFIELKKNISRAFEKPVDQLTRDGMLIKTWVSMTEAGKKLGFNYKNISLCCKNQRKTAFGYTWRYAYENSN